MSFGSPLWLLGLIPWAAVTLYLLWGRRRQQRVPFLDLWIGPVTGPRPRRRLAAPPVALAAAVLAMLLALLAAAQPRLHGSGARGGPVTVIIDRGASMSARGATGTRFVETAERLADELAKDSPSAIDVITVPGSPGTARRTGAAALAAEVRRIPRTAVDTGLALDSSVARALSDTRQPVIVITDRPRRIDDARVVHVAPESRVRNVGIARVAVRESPAPQAMVRVRNDSRMTAARLEITTAGATSSADVQLQAAGAEPTDTFIDLPQTGDVVKVRLAVEDGFEADDVAWLVREGSWPRIEPRVPLPPELARVVEVYAKSRPPGENSATVVIVTDVAAVPPGAPAVVVAPALQGAAGPVEAALHPVTGGLAEELSSRAQSIKLADAPAGEWTPLVRVGGKTAVAFRERPARQVWVGFELPQWGKSQAFVVFWAKAFDWLGGTGGATFRSLPAGPLSGPWHRVDGSGPVSSPEPEPGLWPGLYERGEDESPRAVNALNVQFPAHGSAPQEDWRRRLRAVAQTAPGATGFSSWLLVSAVACLTLTALTWRPRAVRAGPVVT